MPDSIPAPTPVLLGYADRFSVAPGESIRFMVSCQAPSFRAQLVRLIHGDMNPAGPGYQEEPIASSIDGTRPGRRQTIAAGSYVCVPLAAPLDLSAGLTLQAWVWPTLPATPGGQALVACQSPAASTTSAAASSTSAGASSTSAAASSTSAAASSGSVGSGARSAGSGAGFAAASSGSAGSGARSAGSGAGFAAASSGSVGSGARSAGSGAGSVFGAASSGSVGSGARSAGAGVGSAAASSGSVGSGARSAGSGAGSVFGAAGESDGSDAAAGAGSLGSDADSEWRGFVLGLDETGRLQLELGREGAEVARVTHAGAPLPQSRWTFVAATFDAASGTVRLVQASAEPYGVTEFALHEESLELGGSGPILRAPQDLLIAARARTNDRLPGAYNGKIDRPKLFGRALSTQELEDLRQTSNTLPPGVLAAWDFSAGIDTTSVRDASPNGLNGITVNLPTRAVTDHTWSGHEARWTVAPDQYAAIHFHDDDLEDAGWQPDFELTVPAQLRSGVYAARLQAEGGEEYIPFYVRPPRGRATAPVAFLAPTLTYLAYANERMYWNVGYLEKRPRVTPLRTEPPDLDQYLAEHRELGLSLYDVHTDGSGCGYSSRLRPILNMRPKYRAWRLHDAPRHFAADLFLVAWLEERGFAYDVITDEDLHREGSSLLGRYSAVLTGSHPEYYTEAMHTGVKAYLDSGGRLMYLGGNGFYWVTSVDPEHPHVIELRRGILGTRAWESLPGELYHSTTGELGGLWRLRGWSPQRLVGVGFAAQGWGGAAGYRRLPDSHAGRVSFIFDGVGDDEVIGDFGFVLGGAAGDEIDRFDARLGTPAHALLLASSAGQHTDYYQVTVEDVPVMVPGQGGTESPKVRADMVFFTTPAGGAVFSVGSINWLGALGWNAYDNNVSRVTENVLRRFIDPSPID